MWEFCVPFKYRASTSHNPLGHLKVNPAAKSLQSCPTLCNPIDRSPPGSPVPGVLQARTLELVAISFSNAWKWKVKGKSLNCVRLLETPWTTAYQAPPSMGFSRQEYWSGVPLPSPESKPYWPSKSNILGTCLPSAGIPSWGTWCRVQNPCFLRRNSAIVIILPLWVAHQQVWALTIP